MCLLGQGCADDGRNHLWPRGRNGSPGVSSALLLWVYGLVVSPHFGLGLHHTLEAQQMCQGKPQKTAPRALSSAQGSAEWTSLWGKVLVLLGLLQLALLTSSLCVVSQLLSWAPRM